MNDKLIELISKAVHADTDAMCADAGQITLGELVARLEAADQSAEIQFVDGSHPGQLGSYRGYYRLVAIERGENKTVAAFLKDVQEAIGGTFTGYKGGEYTMSRMTPVWVSEYGEASGQGLVGVETVDSIVILKVARIEKD